MQWEFEWGLKAGSMEWGFKSGVDEIGVESVVGGMGLKVGSVKCESAVCEVGVSKWGQ